MVVPVAVVFSSSASPPRPESGPYGPHCVAFPRHVQFGKYINGGSQFFPLRSAIALFAREKAPVRVAVSQTRYRSLIVAAQKRIALKEFVSTVYHDLRC